MADVYDMIVAGSGPAGLTAALYASRSKLKTLVVEKETIGGKVTDRDLIENYPSYPDGIMGAELSSRMVQQVMNLETEISIAEISSVRFEDGLKVLSTSAGEYFTRALIIASGANNRKLGIPGEKEFGDRGVMYCATCDGPKFANKVVVVAGGGDSGITEGLVLARIASKVIVVEMMPACTATKILMERALANPKMEIKCGTRIDAVIGDDRVRGLEITDVVSGKKNKLEIDGLLVHIGLTPNTGYLKDTIAVNKGGYILVNERMETQSPGVFAAGDIRCNSPMQISTAVGDGATAAMSAQKYLAGKS